MYQLLCHVNVPAPAGTCLTRTADRAILDSVPVMKRTVVITIKYYDNFKGFGTILVCDRYRYLVIHFIYNFQPGIDGKRTRKRWPFLTKRTLGELGRVRHGGIRYGALSSQRSHNNAYAVLSPLAATLLMPVMAQTQSIIVTCTGFHAFGTRSRVWRR